MTALRLPITAAAASTILLSLVAGAHADVSPDAVLDGLKRQFALQGLDITAASAELSGGNDVLLSGVTIDVPSADNDIKLERILLEQVSEAGNGAFVIGRIAAPAFQNEQDGYTLSLEGAAVEGYYVAGPDETDPIVKGGVYRAVTVGGVAVSRGSTPVFTLEGMTATMSPYEPGATMEYDVEVKDFSIDFSQVEDPRTRASMTELGYGTMTGRMTADGSWNTDSGDMSMDQAIVLDDAATLNIDFAIGGYTPELVAALQQVNLQMEEQGEEAMGFGRLGLMQQISIDSVTIELVDDSATGRILDFVAKQQGTNRESVIAQAKLALPAALVRLQVPDFAAKVTAAVGTFLDDPGSLTIAARPANAVPVVQIMGAAMTSPQSIIGVLGLDATANE